MKQLLTASITSIISQRPVMFKTDDNKYGVAVYGLLIPYRRFLSSMIKKLHNNQNRGYYNWEKKMEDEIRSFHEHVDIPFSVVTDSHWTSIMIDRLFLSLRKENPKEQIIEMIREVETRYLELSKE